jgi:hypothetical protein
MQLEGSMPSSTFQSLNEPIRCRYTYDQSFCLPLESLLPILLSPTLLSRATSRIGSSPIHPSVSTTDSQSDSSYGSRIDSTCRILRLKRLPVVRLLPLRRARERGEGVSDD